jgi:Tol biopolymer transport system component
VNPSIRSSWRRVVALSLCLLATSAVTASAQYFGKNKVRYDPFDWHVYHSPHFSVYYYPKSEAQLQKVVSMAESAYDRLSREFDYQIQEPTPLLLFATHSEFLQNNIILNFIPEGVAAFATSARFRMVMPIDLPDRELYELILHELTHIFQYHILFGGSLGKSLTLNPPTWLVEGMASYYAEDESTSDRMFLRDAVVNDLIPPVTQTNVQGFFAYRFGHAAFDFMEERWGRDGVLDFLFEFRNTIGARVGRAIERAFRIEPEDFDVEFRRWLRRKYLPELVATGEPSDFGRPFRTERGGSQELSPVASPSGDLVAAFSTVRQDLDIVLFDTRERRLLRNLTRGYTTDFRNFVGQHLTTGRRHGHDIAFSPDGNHLAAFVRKEAGFSLAIVDVLRGGVRRVIDMDVEQQTAPAWSPDGKTIAFSGNRSGQFDIFLLDLDSLEIRNLTTEDIYDGAPAFSPDGKRLAFVSVLDEGSDIFLLDLDTGQRTRVTADEWVNTDPVFSSDGKRIFFTSDRTGAENIYGLDLESRQLTQYTNTITGAFMPAVLRRVGEPDRLVYTGYWKGRFDLYESEIEEPLQVTQLEPAATATAEELPRFEPDILVSIDESKKEAKRGFRLFLEDADAVAAIDDDQTVVGQIVLQFSDFFGDRRLIGLFQSVESFSNFQVSYYNLSRRWQWGATLFDDNTFFVGRNFFDGRIERVRSAYQLTGATASLIYPFSFYRRFELTGGYFVRDINAQAFAFDSDGNPIFDDDGNPIPTLVPREDDYPQIGAALVSDTTIFGAAGPRGGHRVRFSGSWAPDIDESGTLTSTVELDARKYFPLSRRTSFATRFFGSSRSGAFPNPVYFGGYDTVRGIEFRDLVGDRGFFTNVELRFPLIDYFVTPVISFQGIQGRLFFDVGAAWFPDVQKFDLYDSETDTLQDAIAAYGFGFTISFFGLDLHFDFAKTWDLETSSDTRGSFWIGQRF